MPEFREVIIAIIGGVSAALCTGGPLTAIFLYYRNRTDTSIRTLKDAIKHLRDEKIKNIETKIEAHIKEDQVPELLNEIKHLNLNLGKVSSELSCFSNKLESTRIENGEQRSDIKNNNNFIQNVNSSLQDHKKEPHGK